ncbi:MAG: NAD(P)H-hydrate dehydratase [Acidobacteria bacterium]|nr:NAD(P)H-hydrate dehydratase [Acidobacteriota bacterium]
MTAQQMREIDRLSVEIGGIPYPTLMENAGARVVEAIIENYGPVEGKRFVVYCGKGNNGGDGAVIARLLRMKDAQQVALFLLGSIDQTRGEARTNLEIVERLYPEDIHYLTEISDFTEPDFRDAGDFIVIDALLGTGISRPAEAFFAGAIELINRLKTAGRRVVSVDIPSGLSSDTGQIIGPNVHADLTVTFTSPKIGNILPPACYANGKLVVASIGTPDWLLKRSGSHLHLVEKTGVRKFLSESHRSPDAHKGAAGDVLLIAGSRGKTGAAALSANAALRAGAGLVTVATARSAQSLLINQSVPEVMTEALDELASGAISHAAIERALLLAKGRTVIALGPGLSSAEESTRGFAREFVEKRITPLVIDADGLNALAPWPAELQGSDMLPIIITPHPGEMARLIGRKNTEVLEDRTGVARDFAIKHQVITVLKGNRTIIAAPDGTAYVNPTGNAGMATAGSGDVLTGLIAGLLAQCPSAPFEATIAGVYLHGLAGDIAANKLGMRSLIASDITAHISAAILKTGDTFERG